VLLELALRLLTCHYQLHNLFTLNICLALIMGDAIRSVTNVKSRSRRNQQQRTEETKELWQMLTWSLFHVGFGSPSTSEANFACWSRSRIMNLE
jgi:hypothetical protein